MLAKMTVKNQLTLPKAVVTRFTGVKYFDVSTDGASIVLRPLQRSRAEEVRRQLAALGIDERDVAAAVEWARSIVALLDGTPLVIAPERLPLYHAAAVMASNYVHALTNAAVILMVSAGLEAGTALGALAPLIRSSAENSIALGPDRALTGPIERGDEETVRRHLRALACCPPEVGALYRAAGLQVLGIARRRGLAEAAAGRIESLLR